MGKSLFELWNRYNGRLFDLAKNVILSLVIAGAGIFVNRGAAKLIAGASEQSRTSGKTPKGAGTPAAGKPDTESPAIADISLNGLKIDDTVSNLLRLTVRYGIFIICLIMIFNVFGINTASFLAILGAAGIAVGLALKDTLSNIAAGIILLFLGTYRRGDYIEFGAYSGTVKEISLFTTILETPDGVYISAPNSSIWGTPLKNYTRNSTRRMDIAVPIAYSDSIDTAFRVVKDLAAAESRFLADPAPQILVQSYGDSSVNVLLRVWVPTALYWPAYWDQMRVLKEKLEEAGLSIPFPQRDVHLYTEPKPAPGPAGGPRSEP
ncbi:MAG: mechanosensitive ion channel family protein [Treponema sp.]|jgi:small conductance mechanosensitive channel|nr:mechanosensitive ion channel family protein [Treponema sp.]